MQPVFGLWEEATVPGENPRMHWENMETHREDPEGIWTRAFSQQHSYEPFQEN